MKFGTNIHCVKGLQELLKRFSRSEVKGQSRSEVKKIFCVKRYLVLSGDHLTRIKVEFSQTIGH